MPHRSLAGGDCPRPRARGVPRRPSCPPQDAHKLSGTLPENDTPSLVGLARQRRTSRRERAAILEALLRDRGTVHGRPDTARLSELQLADLTAFLETL
jgi:hypothetical protein